MTKKQEQIKSLTWKYFFQQKLKEIGKVVGIVLLIIIVPYLIGDIIGGWIFGECTIDFELECDVLGIWTLGFMLLGLGGGILVLFFIVLKSWIKFNWKKAKQRAEKEVHKR